MRERKSNYTMKPIEELIKVFGETQNIIYKKLLNLGIKEAISNKYLYMKITTDIYELPLMIADSVQMLSEMTGDSKRTIHFHIQQREKLGKTTPYIRVKIDNLNSKYSI